MRSTRAAESWGLQVKTSVGDDQTTAGVATDNAQRMIERDGAVMITGGSSTGTAVAVSALCQRMDTLFMATLTHGDETTNQNCHKHTFRRYNDAYMSAQSLARTLISKYGTGTWFHITADYSWGWSVHDNLAAVVNPKGAKEIAYVKLKLGTTDFSSALSQAQAAKPDVLVLTEFGADMVNCLNQAATFGLTKIVQDPRAARRRIHGQRHQEQLRQRRLDRTVLLAVSPAALHVREEIRRGVLRPLQGSIRPTARSARTSTC